MNEKKELFSKKALCCNCKACVSVCPKNAIRTVIDKTGAEYPKIDYDMCINCGACIDVCAYQNKSELAAPAKCYAAATMDKEILMKSASGGIATALGKSVLDKGGIIVGSSMEYNGEKHIIHHVSIDDTEELYKLQGSKYVQSDTEGVYECVKEHLKSGKKVLFIGTPCQVAAIKRYFKSIDCKNLYTIDIICHGVPSAKILDDYIDMLEIKHRANMIELLFRDKSYCWGYRGRYVLKNRKGKTKKYFFNDGVSSYYYYFLRSEINRENCYTCPYAHAERAGDITIGDFWGIDKECPEYLKENGGIFDVSEGVSCVLVNSSKGRQMLDEHGDKLILKEVKFSQISKHNGQLNQPSEGKNKLRDRLMDLYVKEGYYGMEKYFRKIVGYKYHIRKIRNKLRELIKA